MNPKTLKSVYKQINKEELKSEKVELAAIDDAAKALNDFVALRKKAADDIDNAYVYIRRMEKEAQNAVGKISMVASYARDLREAEGKVEQKIDIVRKMARELGIDINTDIIDLNMYNNTIKLSDNLQQDAAKFIKFLNNLPKFKL